jgi:phage-related baseplate assembly protein
MTEAIDFSTLARPAAIEPLDYETLLNAWWTRFLAAWETLRAINPALPQYNFEGRDADPVAAVAQAWSFIRLLDRARVNDAVLAVLAPFATGSDLDAIVARQGLARLVVVPATETTAAITETDDRLRLRYYASFDRPSAGSPGKYIYETLTAWPACHSVVVLGRAVHGRRGDVEVVICGPAGRAPTADEMALVRTAIHQPGVKAEATSVSILAAKRAVYTVALRLRIRSGPSPDVVVSDARSRVASVTEARARIGAAIPSNLLPGAAYDPTNVIEVLDLAPVRIAADPYTVPVCEGAAIDWVAA